MKLTTKILMGLAIGLFAIPIVAVSYINKTTRIDTKEYERLLNKETKEAKSGDHFLKTLNKQQFNNVLIEGNLNYLTSLTLINSTDYAVKVQNIQDNPVVTSIDANGNLRISINKSERYNSSSLYIFGPKIEQINVKNVNIRQFNANQAKVTIVGDQMKEFGIGGTTKVDQLNLTFTNSMLDHNSYWNQEGWKVKNMNLKLINSQINLAKGTVDSLNVNLDQSNLNFFGDKKGASLAALQVNTKGRSILSFQGMPVLQTSGALSDSTQIDLPMVSLRKLLK